MMTDLVRDDIGLRKVSRRVKPLPQLFIKRQINVDLLVSRTVKRPDRGAIDATRRLHLVRKKNESRIPVMAAGFLEDVCPHILSLRQHHADEMLKLFLFGVSWPGSRHSRRRRATARSQVLPRIGAEQQRQYYDDQRAQPSADHHAAAGKASPIFNVFAFSLTLPAHCFSPLDLVTWD